MLAHIKRLFAPEAPRAQGGSQIRPAAHELHLAAGALLIEGIA